MIKIIKDDKDIEKLLSRSQLNLQSVNDVVADIIENVKEKGDNALFSYAKKFDDCDISSLLVTKEEIEKAYSQIDSEVLSSIRKAKENILAYHKKQMLEGYEENNDGAVTGWVYRPMQSAGIYIPGGTAAYPSSVLMTALPAIAAGVENIYMVTPFKGGKVNPLTLVAANECGVSKIFKVGGAQAIAALAFGTQTIPKVDIIVGPGNIYVTVAKKMVYGYVGIDMIAGPSEILIVADDSANPEYLAADLLSQAEHDTLATAILVTTSEKIAKETKSQVEVQLEKLPRKDIATQSLDSNSAIILVDSIDKAIEISNRVAPEHLELCFECARQKLDKIKNAGAVFIGNYSPEPLGDYFAGPCHVLPTSGTAKYFSVLNTLTFLKRTSIIEYDRNSLLAVSDDIIRLAECEGLHAHANSVRVRKK